jgi:WD40 repeat protein
VLWQGGLTPVTAPDGEQLLVITGMGGGGVYSPSSLTQVGAPLRGHIGLGGVTAVCAVPLEAGTRSLLATAGRDGTIRLWNLSQLPAPGLAQDATGSLPMVAAIAAWQRPDGHVVLATGHRGKTVRLVDLETGELAGPYLPPWADHLAAVPVPRRGRTLLATAEVTDAGKQISLWDPETGQRVSTPLREAASSITAMAGMVGPDGTGWLATSGDADDGVIRLWDAESGAVAAPPLAGHDGGYLHDLAVLDLPGAPVLASAGHDHTVRLWSPHEGPRSTLLGQHGNVVTSVTGLLTPTTGPLVASSSSDGTVRVWEVAGRTGVGRQLDSACHHAQVATVHRADGWGIYLVVAGDGFLELWDPADLTLLHRMHCFPAEAVFRLRTAGARLVIGGLKGVAVLELTWPTGRATIK